MSSVALRIYSLPGSGAEWLAAVFAAAAPGLRVAVIESPEAMPEATEDAALAISYVQSYETIRMDGAVARAYDALYLAGRWRGAISEQPGNRRRLAWLWASAWLLSKQARNLSPAALACGSRPEIVAALERCGLAKALDVDRLADAILLSRGTPDPEALAAA